MNYKVIEKNDYCVRVRNYSEFRDCNLCKNVAEKRTCKRIECAPNSYYLQDPEVEKLESELTPETFTINDMYVESKLLFNCQEQLEDLQLENKQLKDRVKELETTIENMKAIAGEKIEPIGGISSVDYQSDKETESLNVINSDMYYCVKCHKTFEIDENFNYCPNCGRKIVR